MSDDSTSEPEKLSSAAPTTADAASSDDEIANETAAETAAASTPAPEPHGSSSLRPERRASREKLKADARRVSRETGKTLGKLDYARPRRADEAESENNTDRKSVV